MPGEQRSIEMRLRANFSEFNSQIDQAAQKGSKFGQALEDASRKVEQARLRQRDAAQQVVAAESRLDKLQQSSKATSQQLQQAQREVTRARNANRAATDALTTAEKRHQEATKQSTTFMGRLAQSADENSEAWNRTAGVLTAAGAAILALGVAAVRTGVDYNALQQSSRAALKTLLGGAEAANAQMDKLDAFAKTSPFSKQTFITAQQQMLAFGVATEKVIPYLSALNDTVAAAGGNSQTLSELAFVMAQISAAGKITGQDLIQFGQRGVDAATMIGQSMGKTGAEIRSEITAGTLDAGEALDALAAGLAKSNEGAAANVKQTWVGATDRISAAWRDLSAELAEPLVGKDGGGALVDWANAGADGLRKLQAAAADLPPELKLVAGGLIAVLGASALVAGGIALLGPKVVQLRTDAALLGAQFPKLATAMRLGKLAAGGLGAALTIGVTALVLWQQHAAEAAAKAQEFADTLKVIDGRATFTSSTLSKINDHLIQTKTLLGFGPTLIDLMDQVGVSVQDAQGYLAGEADAIERVNQAVFEFTKAHPLDASMQTTPLIQGLDDLRNTLSLSEKQALQKASADKQAGVAADDAGEATKQYSSALARNAAQATTTADKIQVLIDSIFALSEAQQRQRDANLDWHQTLLDANKTLDDNAKKVREHGKALSLNTQAGLDNQAALDSIGKSARSRISQLIEEGKSTDKVARATQKARQEYIEAAHKAGYYGQAAQELADKAGLIPKNVKIKIAEFGAVDTESALTSLTGQLEGLPKSTQMRITSIFVNKGVEAAYTALAKIDQEKADAFINSILKRGGIDEWANYDPKDKNAYIDTYVRQHNNARQGGAKLAGGGGVWGPGTETSDSIPALLSNNEHVLSAREVRGFGGHGRVERLRAMARSGTFPAFADGGRALSRRAWRDDTAAPLRLADGGPARLDTVAALAAFGRANQTPQAAAQIDYMSLASAVVTAMDARGITVAVLTDRVTARQRMWREMG